MEMTDEKKRLIRVRSEKGTIFTRYGFGTKAQLSASWRRPRGMHNKKRRHIKAKGPSPRPGYGSPVAVRCMHPSGFMEVRVFSPEDLECLDPVTQAVRIAGSVGGRKRALIQERAREAGLKILNLKEIAQAAEEAAEPEEEVNKDE
jgi:large subunit ribosomal protein L32e